MSRLHDLLDRIRNRFSSLSQRGAGFWIGTVLLGLLLPAPVAIVAVTARLRARGRLGAHPPGRP